MSPVNVRRIGDDWVEIRPERDSTVITADYQTFVGESHLEKSLIEYLEVGLIVFADIDLERLCRAPRSGH